MIRQTNLPMDIIGLRLLVQLGTLGSVNHPPVHGNGLGKDCIEESLAARMPHTVDASLRQCKVDGFSKVKRNSRCISEVYLVVRTFPSSVKTTMKSTRNHRGIVVAYAELSGIFGEEMVMPTNRKKERIQSL